MTPRVSVIMPVYNCVDYIKESTNSILKQTFGDFEFLIIDDQSTDGTYEYLQTLVDPRIKLIRKPKNSGYTTSLNIGLEIAKGEYIARMDGDDISLPERFAMQISFMDNNPDVLVSGTCYKIMNTDTIIKMPITFEEAKVISIMHVPVAHPTVFIRRSALTRHQFIYNEKFEPAEDYDLWTRILQIGKIENLPEVLLLYRRHNQQESITKLNRLIEAAVEIRNAQLEKLLIFNDGRYDILFAIAILTKESVDVTTDTLKKIMLLLTDMHKSNKKKGIYNDGIFSNYLRDVWLFYVPKFNTSHLRDVTLLIKMRNSVITRMKFTFNLRFLKKILTARFASKIVYSKNSLQN